MRRLCKLYLLFFVACSGINTIHGKPVEIKVSVEPGGIKQIDLGANFNSDIIICGDKKFEVGSSKENKFFVYSESYFSDLNSKKCQSDNYIVNITVEDKKFPFEQLKVDKKRVSLSKKDLKRVQEEQELLNKLYSKPFQDIIPNNSFQLPIKSLVTSEYGKKRLFNKKRKSQHLGIDFRAKVGKKIEAANSGIVILSQDLFYTGFTVIIYHGLGIYTVYGHLSKLLVKDGEKVEKGKVIGLSGNSGRVTGPHLHWGVKVNGNWSNGKDLLTLKF